MNKKEKLLNSAKSLMIEKGFVATTVDDICECAGVTKGSFFYYFKDKEQLAKEAVRSFAENGRQIMFCDSMKKEPDPLKRIFGYLDCLVECAKEKNFKGCLVGSFSQELSETHPEIREICATSFDMFIKSLEKDLAEAKKKFAPKASFKAVELAEYFLTTLQGSIILARAKQDRKIVERGLNQYKRHLKLLFETE